MKVILLQDIENLGKKYDVKEVKSGYARNFLMPRELVKPATKEAMQWLKNQKELTEKIAEEDLKKSQELASKIDGLELNIVIKVGEDGQMFESVNNQKISEKLKEMGFEIKKSKIILKKPIKELGEFPVNINLDHNLEVEIKVIVSAEKQEKTEEE